VNFCFKIKSATPNIITGSIYTYNASLLFLVKENASLSFVDSWRRQKEKNKIKLFSI